MTRKSEWFLQLPTIRRELEQLSCPVVDRAIFEKVFHVRRRRAIQLMHYFGGFQSGRTFLVERSALLRSLAALESGEDFGVESGRRQRLSEELEKLRGLARASHVAIPVTPLVYQTRLACLPPGVQLGPGRLTVLFETPEQLLERLFVLSQALVNDWDLLEEHFRPSE